ncbi:hypothetical protein C364_00787 [Cryptococcus neoformans Bt63]|nr:hypothetical protein C364_00787 [Cryptococcus neoformans var. grubii Bt63]
MSNSPLRPLHHPPLSRPSSGAPPLQPQLTGDRKPPSSSASSSQAALNQAGRADQVLYRFYLKTVAVLVEGRLTHYANVSAEKKDRWFNLLLPEIDLYKNDLQIYRSISSYPSYAPAELPSPASDTCSIPPLLIAFILDTSDVPNGQALLWNRRGGKVALDLASLSSKGKGKGKEERPGIILERWTLRAQSSEPGDTSSSQIAPHTAYRLGIIHFRALHSLVRLFPAYRLYKRLRRSNSGLRLGIKLWGPEGYPNSPGGLKEAWDVMEEGLISLDTGLEKLVIEGEQVEPESIERYDFPRLDLFGNGYTLQAEYRPEVDFSTEDMEAVLSEKFVDMDEDWFTPTVAARRRSESNASTASTDHARTVRKPSMPAPIPSGNLTTSPIPPRQQAATAGSFASAGSFSRARQASISAVGAQSKGKDRWGALGEGLPFAGRSPSTSQLDGQAPPSPNPGAIVAARRLSGHSIQPFASASPSTSMLRGTPPQPLSGAPIPTSSARPTIPASRPSSSIGRTSSFLSQSGRSFTHAQLANMYGGSASPPVTGAMSGVHHPSSPSPYNPPGQSPISPSSLTFAKQPVPRNISMSSRGMGSTPGSGSSPFIPGSLERDTTTGTGVAEGSAPNPPHIIKRYSSSFSSRPSSLPHRPSVQSQGSSADASLPSFLGGQGGQLRRTSTRESGLRHSLEPPKRRNKVPDEDDIEAFLKTLDAVPQPSRSQYATSGRFPSMGSSLSTREYRGEGEGTPNSQLATSPLAQGQGYNGRVPMTRAWVDDELKRMAGSLGEMAIPSRGDTTASSSSNVNTSASSARASAAGTPASIGLLSASRPSSASRRVPITGGGTGEGGQLIFRRRSGGPSPLSQGLISATGKGSSPLAASPMQALRSADQVPADRGVRSDLSDPPTATGSARSLPRSAMGVTHEYPEPLPLRSAGAGVGYAGLTNYGATTVSRANGLSPQTTGETSSTNSPSTSATTNTTNATTTTTTTRTPRRGPVLLRGGFEHRSSATSTPSHSPVRDYARAGVAVNAASASGAVGLGISSREARVGSMPIRQVGDEKERFTELGRRQSASIAMIHAQNASGAAAPAVGPIGRYRPSSGTAPGSLGREEYGKQEGRECIERRTGSEGPGNTRKNRTEEGDGETDDGLAGLMNGLGIERRD